MFLSRQSVGFIYKRANRRADDSFHADGEQITGNPLQLPSRALIRCHRNKAALLRSDQECAFSPQLPMRGPRNLIEGEFAVRRWNIWQTVKDNGQEGCCQFKAHPVSSHVSFKSGYTDVPHWWPPAPPPHSLKKTQLNIDTLAADITGLRPFLHPLSKHSASLTALLAPLSFSSLWMDQEQHCRPLCAPQWKDHSSPPRLTFEPKRGFIVTTSGLLEHAFNADILKVSAAEKRGPFEIKCFHDDVVGQCQILGNHSQLLISILGKVRIQSFECY